MMPKNDGLVKNSIFFIKTAKRIFLRNYSANLQIKGAQSRFPAGNWVVSPKFAEIQPNTVIFYFR